MHRLVGILTILLATLVACQPVSEPVEPMECAPGTVTVTTAQGSYSGSLTVTEGVYTWQLTEPAVLAGLTFICTDSGCTMAVGAVRIPLDSGCAAQVRSMLDMAIDTQRSSHAT